MDRLADTVERLAWPTCRYGKLKSSVGDNNQFFAGFILLDFGFRNVLKLSSKP